LFKKSDEKLCPKKKSHSGNAARTLISLVEPSSFSLNRSLPKPSGPPSPRRSGSAFAVEAARVEWPRTSVARSAVARTLRVRWLPMHDFIEAPEQARVRAEDTRLQAFAPLCKLRAWSFLSSRADHLALRSVACGMTTRSE